MGVREGGRGRLAPLGPEVRTLDAALAERAASAPDALAFADTAEGGERLSYGRLLAEVEALAGGLAGLGVEPGDRIALLLPAGLDFIHAFFALQRLGAAPCAFDPQAPEATAARRAARLRPRLALVAGPATDSLVRACAEAGVPTLALAQVPRTTGAPPVAPASDVAFLQPTSGTAGEPRAAVISQANVIASLRIPRDLIGLGPHDVLVSWVPPWHDLGLLRFVLGPVYFGAPCHLVPPAIRTLPRWLATASEVRATVLGAPDFAYRLATRLVDPEGLDLSALRYATNGGEPVRQATILAFEERFGVPGAVRPGYGLAEATLGVTGLRPGELLRVDERGNVSCGRPLPEVEVRIAAETPEVTEAGEILVRGPNVFTGYFDAEEASREALRDGWLHTGDVGRLDADGHLYVLGRKRAMIKRGGAPLAPREVEEAVERVPGLRIAAAVGLPPTPEATTEAIVVVAEADPAARSAPSDLATAAAAAIEAAIGHAPDRVVLVAPRTIPRTANGKLRHQTLRLLLAEGELERSGAVLFSALRSPI